MLTRPHLAVAAFVAAIALCGLSGCQTPTVERTGSTATGSPSSTVTLTVLTVLDGDTFIGKKTHGGKITVRLLGIDAPEVAHDDNPADCGGDAAARALKKLLGWQTVTVQTDPASDSTDRYGRMLAYVSVPDGPDDAALAQVKHGFAEAWYPASAAEPSRFTQYRRAEQRAREDRSGSWAGCSDLGR